ncbi:MAG: septum formation family protein [Woeseiaceae bacterium]|nr:septum formation family protein [Woeseiaceae bacterium]
MKNWGFAVLIIIGAAAYNAVNKADRDSTGAIVDEGTVDAFNLRLGDCFDDTSSLMGGEGGEVDSLPGVPCSEPHDNEVYAVFDLDITSLPPEDELFEMAFDECHARFSSFVGTDYESSQLDILTLYPTPESYRLEDDREVVCAVYDLNAQKLVGSAEGLGL